MAPNKEQRIAAHRYQRPTVRAVVKQAVALYVLTFRLNKRLWAQFTLGLAGAAFFVSFMIALVIGVVFHGW
jgi:hypothetical protein